jgi:hypothetical protein
MIVNLTLYANYYKLGNGASYKWTKWANEKTKKQIAYIAKKKPRQNSHLIEKEIKD